MDRLTCIDCGSRLNSRASFFGTKRCKRCAQIEIWSREPLHAKRIKRLRATSNTPENKAKRVHAGRVSWANPESRIKHIAALTGEEHWYWKGGPDARASFCEDCGKRLGPTANYRGDKRCFRCRFLGERNPNWRGGCIDDYGNSFSDELKEKIKKRDDYLCQFPGCYLPQNGTPHSVHHCDYNKRNQESANLITLCVRHHAKTTFGNREHYTELFAAIQEARGL
jgi:hypothetical protein